MRAAHVITRLIVGGAQENTVATVLGLLRKDGFQVSLISGPSRGPEGSLESAFDPCPGVLTIMPQLVRAIRPWSDWLALRGLTRHFCRLRPDLVHTHSGKAGILGRLAASRANVPLIVHTIHGPSFGSFQSAPANAVFRAAERRAAGVTHHFIVVADAMKQQYLAEGIGRPEQYTKILSGFELEPYLAAANDPALRAKWGIAPEDFVLGKIARLTRLKGHDDLFAAAPELVKRCPRIKFLLVGDGEWRARFEAGARALGLAKHFVFTGLVQPQSVPALVGIMDALVHLSAREGLARALPQALAAGRPVVAYDSDGAGEVCFENETGFLLHPGDRSGLIARVAQLAHDAALRERLGRQGRQFVQQHFAAERMVDAIYDLYLSLVGRVAAPS
jgi:glycosyltransferase involved in cell wall biosynthesis